MERREVLNCDVRYVLRSDEPNKPSEEKRRQSGDGAGADSSLYRHADAANRPGMLTTIISVGANICYSMCTVCRIVLVCFCFYSSYIVTSKVMQK